MTNTSARAALLTSLALFSAPAADVAAASPPAERADQGADAGKDRAIQPKDQLMISLDGLEGDVPNRATVLKPVVDEKGQIKLPYLKEPVTATGLTCGKLQAAIDKAYRDARMVQNANTRVSVVSGKDPEAQRVIRPKDRLTISVRDLEAPNKDTIIKALVDDKGEVKLPYVKEPVRAGDLTCNKLEDAIGQAYRDARIIEQTIVKVAFAKEQKP